MARRAIEVAGMVQGVGFRPFVFGLATRLGLHGLVRNHTGGVVIEVEGELDALDQFLVELTEKPPPLSRIDHVACVSQTPLGDTTFRIATSANLPTGEVFILPDVATCENCLVELFDPTDRRYRYPFLNCSDCGPRWTIIQGMPYDRVRTTMASFAMCALCREKYDDPGNRRFHAQPIACPTCGPRLQILDARGRPGVVADPLAFTVAALRTGSIVAVKGLGGYHLACVASDSGAVAELRRRKNRDEKPFALMVENTAAAHALCDVSEDENELLLSRERPIVLLRKRTGVGVVKETAPRNPLLGVMLPYTPLHQLLLHDLDGMPLVMTSANRCDEPIVFEDTDALARLTGVADLFLTHNRPIHMRCDDSVTRIAAREWLPLRRARGYAPRPIRLPAELPQPTLALGGQLKAAFALGRNRHGFLSHHLGDLDQYEAFRAYVQAIDHCQQLWAIEPELLVHDLHPDYASTRYAQSTGRKLLAVQHHHAHLASCMAEHGLNDPVIGVIMDGTGFGTDGTIWGGEFLVGDYYTFSRAAHFRCVPMPGGDQCTREPWRMALAYLRDAGISVNSGVVPLAGVSGPEIRIVEQMLERSVNSPLTSSAGRLFDAVASLIGVRQRASYEGQAAMELEWLAAEATSDDCYPFEITAGSFAANMTSATIQRARVAEDRQNPPFQIDGRPLFESIVRDLSAAVPAKVIARRFHSTFVEIIVEVCRRLRQERGLDRAVLSGGVFMNALVLEMTMTRLQANRFHAYHHCQVPPNDGGLCLGQLAIAARTRNVE